MDRSPPISGSFPDRAASNVLLPHPLGPNTTRLVAATAPLGAAWRQRVPEEGQQERVRRAAACSA
eukprot:2183962-Rhodomonas_salina.1